MELRYRVLPSLPGPEPGPTTDTATRTDPGLDVAVHVDPGATIADLADALATALGQVGVSASGERNADRTQRTVVSAATRDRPPHPDAPARAVAPRSGSTVAVETITSPSAPAPVASPVMLVPVGAGRATATHLAYGTNTLCLTGDGVLGTDAGTGGRPVATIDVDSSVTLRTATHSTRLELDGEPVLGAVHLRAGQLLRIGPWLGEAVVTGALHPPSSGPLRHHDGRAREWPGPDDVADVDDPVDLPPPPGRRRRPGFPWLSAAVPLVLGLAIWAATRSLAIAGFVVASVAFVVAAALESRREARREHRAEVEEHTHRVTRAVEEVERRATAWRARSRAAHPGGPTVAAGRHRPRWSRHGPSLTLHARLGVTTAVAPVPVRFDGSGSPELAEQARRRLEAAGRGPADVVVDLGRLGVLALVGDGAITDALTRSIVVELAGLVPPDALRIVTVCGPGRAAAWDWVDWLPHVTSSPRDGAVQVVVVDGDDAEARRAATALLVAPRTCALWMSRDEHGVPRGTLAVVRCRREPADPGAPSPVHGTPRAELIPVAGPPTTFSPDAVTLQDAEVVARSWSAYRPLPLPDDASAPPPVLANVLGSGESTGGVPAIGDAASIVDRWCSHAAPGRPSLAAPIGTSGGGVAVLDLAVDGPHALVAGTTGSGKSELLRTWLLSAALCHSPAALNLLLVDYKGGTAFAELDRLPHSVGLVTDLDDHLGERVVVSLRAELRRRERLERSGAPRPPALVVAIDEFATLARELPQFVDGVVDVAQRGRSLGLHLILATQRPAGVVTDAIRANTSLRIAMRVADDDDSRDVVGSVDAARIDPRRPGTGLVRIGTAPARPIRVAFSGGPVDERRPPVRIESLHPRLQLATPDPRNGAPRGTPRATPPGAGVVDAPTTQLAVAVGAVVEAADLLTISAPRRPWRPPLPDRLDPDDLDALLGVDLRSGPDAGVVLGVVDRPDRQGVEPLIADLAGRGGLAVRGARRTGRTTALATTAAALSRRGPVDIHAIHCDGVLPALLPDGCDVVHHDDVERTMRLLRRLLTGPATGRTRLLLFDDADVWCRRHERTNRGGALELLGRLCTDAHRRDLLIAVSVSGTADVPHAASAALGARLDLGDPDGGAWPPGRGALDQHRFQVALPPPRASWAVPAAEATRSLPTAVRVDQLSTPRPWRLPVGLDADRLDPVIVDLGRRHLLILGPPRSGRTGVLETVVHQIRAAEPHAQVLRIDGRDPSATRQAAAVASRLRSVLDLPLDPGAVDTGPLGHAADGGTAGALPVVLAIDDLDELFDLGLDLAGTGGPTATDIDSLLVAAVRRADLVRVVATASVDGVARSFAESARVLRAGRHGVLLTCDPDVHPHLLHTVVPRRDEVPQRPGRGWLVGDADPVLVQFATVAPEPGGSTIPADDPG